MHHFFLVLHLLAASIWIGGHLLLLIRYLPEALKNSSAEIITDFEKKFELIGIPALLIQIITGILMAYHYDVGVSKWFTFENQIEKVISLKLMLLFTTLILAIHARLFIIPKLNKNNLKQLGWHILLVNIIAIAMLILGSFIRFGGI
jgi:putative copper export protein